MIYLNSAYKFFLKNSHEISEFIQNNRLAPALTGLAIAGGTVSAGASVYSLTQGQDTGGFYDYVNGFIDLQQDDYCATGSDQAGKFTGTLGKHSQNGALCLFSSIVATRLSGMSAKTANNLKNLTAGLMAWQAGTGVDEFVRPDRTSNLIDYLDLFSAATSVLSLNSTLGKLIKQSKIVPRLMHKTCVQRTIALR